MAGEGPKKGFYKVINVKDGLALTATEEGRPLKHVIVQAFNESPNQIWKVKAEGEGLYMIRSEELNYKNNEISKETVEGEGKPQPRVWTLVHHAPESAYSISNDTGLVLNSGEGERVTFVPAAEPGPEHKWKFEFIRDV